MTWLVILGFEITHNCTPSHVTWMVGLSCNCCRTCRLMWVNEWVNEWAELENEAIEPARWMNWTGAGLRWVWLKDDKII